MKKLNKKIQFTIPLILKSGLHIGGSNLSMAIGGADNVVIRDPVTLEPVIPGSSIKGKMRSLTEKLLGASDEVDMGDVKNGPYTATNDELKRIIPELYGKAAGGNNNIPSRIIIRDAKLGRDSEKSLKNAEGNDMLYSEVKTEVVIDRVTSAAMPRQLERIPAGSVFELNMILNVFEDDDEQHLIDYIKVGLHLMEDDYLGGSGSRGSGHIELNWDQLKLTQKVQQDYEDDNDWQKHKAG